MNTPGVPQTASTRAAEPTGMDVRRPLVVALTRGVVMLALTCVISSLGWWLSASTPGLYGALIGVAIGGSFLLITTVLSIVTFDSSPAVTGAVVLGGWLVKFVVVMVVLAVIRHMDFYNHMALFSTVVVVMVIVLATEALVIVRRPVLYVSPE